MSRLVIRVECVFGVGFFFFFGGGATIRMRSFKVGLRANIVNYDKEPPK